DVEPDHTHLELAAAEAPRPSQHLSPSQSTDDRGPHHGEGTPANGFRGDVPPIPMLVDVALAALANLPTPILVLSSLKTVLLANAAVGRLLGLNQDDVGTSPT